MPPGPLSPATPRKSILLTASSLSSNLEQQCTLIDAAAASLEKRILALKLDMEADLEVCAVYFLKKICV
jgi:hypothetical protein